MLKNLSVKSKVLIALLAVTIITAATLGVIAAWIGTDTLKEETFKKLTAVRELKSSQIEDYFESVADHVRNYSKGKDASAALAFLLALNPMDRMNLKEGGFQKDLNRYIELFGFRNVYIIDKNGTILYTVKNEIDPGVSLISPAYSGTGLGMAFRKASASSDTDFTYETEFQPFVPSLNEVSSFISSPVLPPEGQAGVVVFQVTIADLNSIMTDDQGWGTMGLGATGETFIAGSDFLIRNQSRFLVEDSANYFSMIRAAGATPEEIGRIRQARSAIGLQSVPEAAAGGAFSGKANTCTMKDYRGMTVLAAYKPLKIKDLNWIIISKIDKGEALHAIGTLFRKFLIYILLLFVCVISFSMVFSRDLSRPVEALAKVNQQLNIQSAAIRSAANGIIITDTRGIVGWVNPAFTELTGYKFDDIVGHSLNILNSGVQSKEFFQDMWTRILAGEVWQNEVVNRRKDGSLYTEEMTITPVHDSQGKITHFVGIKHDITERKRLEQIVRRANQRMEEELNVAKDIQMSMLPLKFPAFPDREDIDVYAKLIPAREVGGDFYDFFFIDEENFCFVIGDVSGKGVPAALFMAVTKALIKSGSRNEISTSRILNMVNSEISRDNENSMFITVFIAILNTTTGYMVYSNAGHNPPFILRKEEGILQKLPDLHGVVIGAFEGLEYKETVLQLNRGDSVFVYTDGVTEAQDRDGNLYSEGRLKDLLGNCNLNDCQDLVNQVLADIDVYEDGAEHADDITIMTMHFREQSADSVLDYLFTSITNKLDNIVVVIRNFEEFAGRHNVPIEIVQKINIVFDELLTNTISYAYDDDTEHEIEIKIRFYKEKLSFTIMDDGTPYNPFDRSDPDTSLGLEERGIGGLGVHLVKLLVDDYHYEYKKQLKKNITSFKKHI